MEARSTESTGPCATAAVVGSVEVTFTCSVSDEQISTEGLSKLAYEGGGGDGLRRCQGAELPETEQLQRVYIQITLTFLMQVRSKTSVGRRKSGKR